MLGNELFSGAGNPLCLYGQVDQGLRKVYCLAHHMDCIFCKIVKGEIPSEKVFESENVFAFLDINPKAKVHVLIIPKKHIDSVKDLEEADKELMGEVILAAKKIAEDKNLEGYKLIINVGREGGQLVDHLHWHLVSPDVKCEHRI